jgi:thiol-disulfide isomerase/thioredoxin
MNKTLVIGGGIVAVLALAVVFAFSGADETAEGLAFGDVTVDGATLPAFEAGTNDPALGTPGPVLTGADQDGATVTIGGSGEPRIVMFLAHWCSHCQREVPSVTDYLAENDVDVEFLAVATGSNATAPNYPPSVWLEREEWPVPTLYDDADSTAGKAYGLSGYPFWVILDGDGAVQSRFSGEVTDEQLQAVVDFAATLRG